MNENSNSSNSVQENILKALNEISTRLKGLEARVGRIEEFAKIEEAPPDTVTAKPDIPKTIVMEPVIVESIATEPTAVVDEIDKPSPIIEPTKTDGDKKEPKKRSITSDLESKLGIAFLMLGIIMVSSAMVFFAGFLFQFTGPIGKALISYAVAAIFTAGGLLLERKVKLFGKGIFSLGLGLIYFTSYAIYFIEPIKVIYSKSIEVILLTLVVGAIVFVADRKKSQFTAGLAIFLGYYTVVVSDVTLYTLLATLLLAAGAIVFLLKNRWTTLPWVALVGSYATYIIWILIFRLEGDGSPAIAFLISGGFLTTYFLLFAITLLILKQTLLGKVGRIIFASLNILLFYIFILISAGVIYEPAYGYVEIVSALLFIGFSAVYLVKSKSDWLYLPYLIAGLFLLPIGLSIAIPPIWAGFAILALTCAVFAISYFVKHKELHITTQYLFFYVFGWTIYYLTRTDTFDPSSPKQWMLYIGAVVGVTILFAIPMIHRKTFEPNMDSAWDMVEKYTGGFGVVLGSILLWFLPISLFSPYNTTAIIIALPLLLYLYARSGNFISGDVMAIITVSIGVILYFASHSYSANSISDWYHFIPNLPSYFLGFELAVVVFALERLMSRHYKGMWNDIAHHTITISAVVFFVIYLPIYLNIEFFSDFVTLSWAGVGIIIFVYGLIAKLRAYRLGGLTLILLAVARLFLVDLADTPILVRTGAFFVTGLVLLAVAFIYIFNREKMKDWL